jgi:peptide/nickel transport system permease protein
VQYVRYVGKALSGDLGTSARTRLPVSQTIGHALPVTLQLSAFALVVAVTIGLGTGIVASVRRRTVSEWAANVVALLGLSIAVFWFGQMVILVFAIAYPVLPASGFVPFFGDPVESLRHLLLPGLVLGTALAAVIMRQTARRCWRRSARTTCVRRGPRVSAPGRSSSATRCATA